MTAHRGPTVLGHTHGGSFPIADYTVHLDAYHGPLDLLLYLVKRHEVDLLNIPIARLTDQYLDHVGLLKAIDVDRAGEFLVMAATLLEIKSQMLAPRLMADENKPEDGEHPAMESTDDDTDPRYELVQQLLAYKRFKDLADVLEDRHDEWSVRAPAKVAPGKPDPKQPSDDSDEAQPIEVDLDDLHIMDLCEAFGRMLESIGHPSTHDIEVDDTPLSLHAEDIEDRLIRDGGPEKQLSLRQICEGRGSRSEMIGLFLAMLELVRQRRVMVTQSEDGEVSLKHTNEHEDTPADSADATAKQTPDPDDLDAFDWPDPQARKRHERRLRLRANRQSDEDSSEDDEANDDHQE